MKLSQHFFRSEFKCSCCDFDTVDARLLEMLEQLRNAFQQPVRINSAARCLKHNRSIGSKDTSQHVLGRAADITVENVSNDEVYNYLNANFPICGLGRYETFTHIDSRSERARWDKR